MASPTVYGPLTKLQCCPTSDGSAAAILVSERFAAEHGLLDQAVEILGIEMATDLPSTFEKSCMKLVCYLVLIYLLYALSPKNATDIPIFFFDFK